MRIADFRVTPIAISDPPLLNAAGLHAPYALRVVADVLADPEGVRHLVVGSDPFRLNALARGTEAHFGDAHQRRP